MYHAKILEKQEYMDKLTEEYQKLLTYKNEKTSPTVIERPPETMEEDQNRKVGNLGCGGAWMTTFCGKLFLSKGLFEACGKSPMMTS